MMVRLGFFFGMMGLIVACHIHARHARDPHWYLIAAFLSLIAFVTCLALPGCVSEVAGAVSSEPPPAVCRYTVDRDDDGRPELVTRIVRNQYNEVVREEQDQDGDGTVDAVTWYERRDDGAIRTVYLDGGQTDPDGVFDWSETRYYQGEPECASE